MSMSDTRTNAAPATDPPAAAPATAPLADGRVRRRSPLSVRFVLRRLVASVIALWGALTVVFFVLNVNGNPVLTLLGPEATQADIDLMTRQLGYDRPVIVQYLTFLGTTLSGRFPDSLRFGESSLDLVLTALPYTVVLAACGLGLAVVVGLVVGYLSANGRNWVTRHGILGLIVGVQALPPVLIGTLLVLFLALKVRAFPTGGAGGVNYLVLPMLTLAIGAAPPIARMFRAAILAGRGADHVRTAQAKGISPGTVKVRHIAMNALLPVINLIGVQAGTLLTGAFVTEALFSWPGIGSLAITALQNQDYPLVLATVSIATIGFIVVNFLVDILGALLDPRLRS